MYYGISITILAFLMVSCGNSSQDLPSVEATPIASKAEIESLQKRKTEDKKALEDERAVTDKRLQELQTQIEQLSKELTANQDMSLAEREKIQKQLDDARKEKQAAEERLNQLKDNQKRLEEQLANAKTSAGQQQSTNGSVSTTGAGSSTSNGGIVTTSGNSSTSSTSPNSSSTPQSTSTSMNPAQIPQVGTAYSCATTVPSTDGTTRLQATFNGGSVPYVVHWIDMSGKLVQISSITAGSSQVVNTTLGHAFQLMSLDGTSCYGRVKVGSNQNIFTVR